MFRKLILFMFVIIITTLSVACSPQNAEVTLPQVSQNQQSITARASLDEALSSFRL